MKDRIPTYAGRIKLIPVDESNGIYDIVRADEPIQEGTPINKNTLLKDETAQKLGLDDEATPNDVFDNLISENLQTKHDLGILKNYNQPFPLIVSYEKPKNSSSISIDPSLFIDGTVYLVEYQDQTNRESRVGLFFYSSINYMIECAIGTNHKFKLYSPYNEMNFYYLLLSSWSADETTKGVISFYKMGVISNEDIAKYNANIAIDEQEIQ